MWISEEKCPVRNTLSIFLFSKSLPLAVIWISVLSNSEVSRLIYFQDKYVREWKLQMHLSFYDFSFFVGGRAVQKKDSPKFQAASVRNNFSDCTSLRVCA